MDIEYGNCDLCNVYASLSRRYYRYDIKCDCCNKKEDNHFEIVRHCELCEPKPPKKVVVYLKPLNIKNYHHYHKTLYTH